MKPLVFTVGHSTHSEDAFLSLLSRHGVGAVVDVRSQPYSRFTPQFNREHLASALKHMDVRYEFLGRELGARTKDPNCYVDGKVEYERLASTDLFRKGLTDVMALAETDRVAIMCAEKDPLTCHRAILVARCLTGVGVDVQHILDNGELESHEDAVTRLLGELKMPSHDLFWSDQDLIAEAYRRRADQIAYVQHAAAQPIAGER
jgi:uncharacterized protein (DUF488 family)